MTTALHRNDDLTVAYLARNTSPGGIDYWRYLAPAYALGQWGYTVAVVPPKRDLPLLLGQPPRVLVVTEGAYVSDKTRQLCEQYRMLLVADVCDDPRDIPGGLPMKDVERLARIARWRDADVVTVNSHAMKYVAQLAGCTNVETFPDMALLDDWLCPTPERPEGITVGIAGGSHHREDIDLLLDVWPWVAEHCPDATFVVLGHEDERLKACVPANRYLYAGWANVTQFPIGMKAIDIGCIPLADNEFNQSKSVARWIGHTLANGCVVASAPTYAVTVVNGRTGYIATNRDAWRSAIAALVESKALFQQIQQRAFADVTAHWSLNAAECMRRINVYRKHYRRVYGHESLVAIKR